MTTASVPKNVDWSFGGTWPYEPHFLESPDGSMHYVDEGPENGPVTLLLHGNPTWGYLYRHFIPRLTELGRRVVVPDLLGFGRSDKPSAASAYTLDRHVQRLSSLLDTFEGREVAIVAHDWGGPIGLAWASSQPTRLSHLVLLNTFGPILPGPLGGGLSFRLLRRAVRRPGMAKFMYQRRNVMVEEFLLGRGLARPADLDELTRLAYRTPHPTVESRVGIAAFPMQIPRPTLEPAGMESARTFETLQPRLSEIAVSLIWGDKDVLFERDVLDAWRQALPNAVVTELPSAGHYLQEDEPSATVDAVVRALATRG